VWWVERVMRGVSLAERVIGVEADAVVFGRVRLGRVARGGLALSRWVGARKK